MISVTEDPLHDLLTTEELDTMDTSNAARLSELDARVRDAEEQFGESEVRDALLERARHLHHTGQWSGALEAYSVVETKSSGVGQKLDTVFARMRIALAGVSVPMSTVSADSINGQHQHHIDIALARRCLEQAHALLEGGGGDWERRNRLKVYEGLYCVCTRDFARAAELLLDSVSTFSCHELMQYAEFAQYAVITAAISLDRPQLRERVVECPELLALQVAAQAASDKSNPTADAYAHERVSRAFDCCRALYECRYDAFLLCLADVWGDMRRDRFLSAHSRHYTREMRIRAYAQFLEPYRSVTLDAMASQFGLSSDSVDTDLARFIASGRLLCRIDRVGGVVESSRVDERNVMYSKAIKAGDVLIDRVQKLSRVIEM